MLALAQGGRAFPTTLLLFAGVAVGLSSVIAAAPLTAVISALVERLHVRRALGERTDVPDRG